MTVTRDYGAVPMLEATEEDPPSSETVIRFLDREAEITTRFGGGFVHSIDGLEGEISGGRSSDWFFFVNGIESSVGAAEVGVRGGDRMWWDYRDWTDAMRTPAVVGSWPEPFAQASTPESERRQVSLDCLGADAPCDAVAEALGGTGAEVGEPADDPGPRILVGPWERVREDPVAAQVERGPAASGVFADFERVRRRLPAAGARPGRRRRPRSGSGNRAGRRPSPRRGATDLGRHRRRRGRGDGGGRGARRGVAGGPLRPVGVGGRRDRAARERERRVRSPLAYAPRPGPLTAAGVAAATVYLGAPAVLAFAFANPIVLAGVGVAVVVAGLLAGAGEALRAAARWGVTLGILVITVNAIASQRGDTILLRGADLPVLGQVDVSAEALVEGAILALRIAVVFCAFAVHSACVDPDRVLRLLRPIARHSALTASVITRLVPLAAADNARLREASALRGPGAAPVGRAALARRLVGGALDRAVDVAATLELRGYARGVPGRGAARRRSRHGWRFAAAGTAMLALGTGAAIAGAGGFEAYPTVSLDADPATVGLALALPALAALPYVGLDRGRRRRG